MLQRSRLRCRRMLPRPRVVHRLLRGVASSRVLVEQLPDERLGSLRDVTEDIGGEGDFCRFDLGKGRVVVHSPEGQSARQEDIHDDTRAPHVALGPVLREGELQDLGCHIVRSARARREGAIRGVESRGNTEVNDLQGVPLDRRLELKQKVFGFQVAVADAALVHVKHSTENLLHDDGGFPLGQVTQLLYSVEELTACAQLQDEVDELAILKGLVELVDVGVVKRHDYVDFTLKPVPVRHHLLCYAFDSPLHTCSLVFADDDRGIATLTDNTTLVHKKSVFQVLPRVVDEQGLGAMKVARMVAHLQGVTPDEASVIPPQHEAVRNPL
mmetsp:Transcript_66709/g.168285  ORF Transcript_66709/g.168285 Transcript_66709/m.168285 type:complete len:327 (-) Transcript_66709:237-1217(-)